jgi:hypothetical protein
MGLALELCLSFCKDGEYSPCLQHILVELWEGRTSLFCHLFSLFQANSLASKAILYIMIEAIVEEHNQQYVSR